jgi:hypothetical protein
MDWILDNWTAIALGAITFADLLVSFNPRWSGRGLGYLRAVVMALAAVSTTDKDETPAE